MDDSGPDQTRVLLGKSCSRTSSNNTTNSNRPIRLFVGCPQSSTRVKDDVGFVNDMDNSDEPRLSDSPAKYGYLEHIKLYKDLCKPDDKSLKKKVRQFYKDQLDFINSLEAILLPKTAEEENEATTYHKRQERIIKILTTVILMNNIILVTMKIMAAAISKSLSVISSVVDSVVDLLTSLILLWTAHRIKIRDIYQYPTGRTRLEPIAIVILSVIMCSASVQVILESGQTLSQNIDYFIHRSNISLCRTLPNIDMSTFPIIIMVLTIVSKAILFILCYRIKNPAINALAADSRNDVMSNIVALVCGLISSNALRNKIKQEAIIVDPIGAIFISVYIIISWIQQANRQVRHLIGLTAKPLFLQQITHLVYNFRPDTVTKIYTIQAVHNGTKFLVEVNIGLPGSMPLAIAHGIGVELQAQLEKLDDVERAFVHLDFEFIHMSTSEHKLV